MNILFVCHHDFRCNSMNHIVGFAAGLSARGHSCAVAVPSNRRSIKAVPAPRFTPLLFDDIAKRGWIFPDGRAADVVHAWTPRHPVATTCLRAMAGASDSARLVVHLEDDEEHLASIASGLPFPELQSGDPDRWRELLDRGLVHPWRHRILLHAADAVTCITPALAAFVPNGTQRLDLPPPVDEIFFRPAPPSADTRTRLRLPPRTRVIVYHGGVNPANAAEVRDLYQAVALLNALARPTVLIRTGRTPDWFRRDLSAVETEHVRDLGFVERSALPPLLALADVLVQPGRPGPFNAHRLPSKLAEFLAVGGPVVMPACNIAKQLQEGTHALFLHRGDPEEIADCCLRLFDDDALSNRLRTSAPEVARNLFDPQARAADLETCYSRLLATPAVANWPALSPTSLDERSLFTASDIPEPLSLALRWAGHEPAKPARSWWKRILS